jgi:hypothetical protein
MKNQISKAMTRIKPTLAPTAIPAMVPVDKPPPPVSLELAFSSLLPAAIVDVVDGSRLLVVASGAAVSWGGGEDGESEGVGCVVGKGFSPIVTVSVPRISFQSDRSFPSLASSSLATTVKLPDELNPAEGGLLIVQ